MAKNKKIRKGDKYAELVIRIPIIVQETADLEALEHEEEWVEHAANAIINYAPSAYGGELLSLGKGTSSYG